MKETQKISNIYVKTKDVYFTKLQIIITGNLFNKFTSFFKVIVEMLQTTLVQVAPSKFSIPIIKNMKRLNWQKNPSIGVLF